MKGNGIWIHETGSTVFHGLEMRLSVREKGFAKPTAGPAPGGVQANLEILPHDGLPPFRDHGAYSKVFQLAGQAVGQEVFWLLTAD